jgi:hypothetical protein
MNRCNHFGRARGRRRPYGASVHIRTKSQLRAAITTDHSTVRQAMSAAVANDVPVAVGEVAAGEGAPARAAPPGLVKQSNVRRPRRTIFFRRRRPAVQTPDGSRGISIASRERTT